jgi:hypothetical protein
MFHVLFLWLIQRTFPIEFLCFSILYFTYAFLSYSCTFFPIRSYIFSIMCSKGALIHFWSREKKNGLLLQCRCRIFLDTETVLWGKSPQQGILEGDVDELLACYRTLQGKCRTQATHDYRTHFCLCSILLIPLNGSSRHTGVSRPHVMCTRSLSACNNFSSR